MCELFFSRPAQCAFVMGRGRKRRLSVGPICDMSSALPNGDPMLNDWMKMTCHAMMLGLESQQVICQRLMRIAAGGKGARFETERMVTEKIAAFGEAAGTLATGGSADKVIRRYRTHVKANNRRLSRRKR